MMCVSGALFLCSLSICGGFDPVVDTPFAQEYHEYYEGLEDDARDVRGIAVDRSSDIWAATKAGMYVLNNGEGAWEGIYEKADSAPAFAVADDPEKGVWVGAWNGLYRSQSRHLTLIDGITGPIAAVCADGDRVWAAGPYGLWSVQGDQVEQHPIPMARSVRAVLPDRQNGIWIATGMGLYRHTDTGTTLYQVGEEILSSNVQNLAYSGEDLWVGGLGGITIYHDGQRTGHFTTKEGLPNAFVRCVTSDADGHVWVGTDLGAARWDGKTWALRHSKRWLCSDHVRAIAFDVQRNAWIATDKGVDAIKHKAMTLAEKEQYFYEVCMKRHVRKPWLVERCRLPKPGSTKQWEPEDDDNDGQYTAMYLAAESFRYAATHNPDAREKARRAFEALHFLQAVTETTGFIARSVVPADWIAVHDENQDYSDRERAEELIKDARFKAVEDLWRPSKDGKWRWKGDTSSDEITGHFSSYGLYYDLAADDDEKERVRDHIARVMDYIIDHGYVLVDIDGSPTRWGVWAPERLNDDPDWRADRGVNAVEILSYLKTTAHITGDQKYEREYRKLLTDHGYKENVRQAKTYEPAWRTHIDDELLPLAYIALLRYETDPELLALYRESVEHWYTGVRSEYNAFANCVYAWLTGENPQRDDTLFMLRDTPLDLISWTIDNSKREDLSLQRAPILEFVQTHRLLPPSERGIIRWDRNPWEAVQGEKGASEGAPTFWLLPYWMARYLEIVEGPRP